MSGTNNHQKQYILCLSTRTWVRDSHGLYDYESSQTKNLNLVLGDSVQISRIKNDLHTTEKDKEIPNEEELILNINYQKNDIYTIDNPVNLMMQPTEENINNL